MKKTMKCLITLLALCLLCAFAGCDPSSYHLSQDELSEIISIELINYDNSEQKGFISWVPDHSSDLKSFDENKQSVLETLDEDDIPQLIDALCECHILYKYFAYDSPNGICLKLTCSNGDFLIVSCNEGAFAGYIGWFSSDGEVSAFIGCFSSVSYFESLVNDYFVTNI